MTLHYVVLAEYIIVAIYFAVGWWFFRKLEYASWMLSLPVIFPLCASTRLMMDVGVMREYDSELHYILILACAYFIVVFPMFIYANLGAIKKLKGD